LVFWLFLLAAFLYAGGQDIYLSSDSVLVSSEADGAGLLLFEGPVSVEYGNRSFSSERAVVWVDSEMQAASGAESAAYRVRCFFEDDVKISKESGYKSVDVEEYLIESSDTLVVDMIVSGHVFLNVNSSQTAEPSDYDFYSRAVAVVKRPLKKLFFNSDAIPASMKKSADVDRPAGGSGGVISKLLGQNEPTVAAESDVAQPADYRAPVNVSAMWEPAPVIEKTTLPDGRNVITVIGRFYIWQRRDVDYMLEFQADRAVLFLGSGQVAAGSEQTGRADMLATGDIESVYIEGDIVFTEGARTIRADSMFYNFRKSQALAVNTKMTRFDPARNIPVIIKAQRLEQRSRGVFAAKDVQISSDEFYLPQLSLNASDVVMTDSTSGEFTAKLNDVSIKYYDKTIFKRDVMVTGGERPELALSKLRMGSSSNYGTVFETQWYLSRLLGYREPEGFDTRLNLNMYSDRGVGAGVESEYERENYYGNFDAYMLKDSGTDRLGSVFWRRNLEPDTDSRGRFRLQHREYLEDDWQFTAELNYLSDRNFLESFYRREYMTEKEPESIFELKNVSGNRAFSMLAKVRLNDFQDQTEELPTFEYHKKGEGVLDGRGTYYGDWQLSRMRERHDEASGLASGGFFSYGSTRHEVDLPMQAGSVKYVPYVAGAYVYNDGDGLATAIDGSNTSPENGSGLGEIGLRASTTFWKTMPQVKSTLWDVNGLRHYVRPHIEMAFFSAENEGLEMRDVVNVGLSQRLQTHRGSKENLRTVDWMSLDVNATFVTDDEEDENALPTQFIFSSPYEPYYRRTGSVGYTVSRDSLAAEYAWNISDTFAFTGYSNTDIDTGDLQQLDLGIARYIWPDMSVYVGTRYLKNLILDDTLYNTFYEHGTNTIRMAMSCRFSPRYSMSLSQEYDWDFGQSVRSEVVLIRRYNRLLYSIGYSIDESIDSSAFTLSIWPQGVKELALGTRNYVGITNSSMYE
jgi:hypothetical protein